MYYNNNLKILKKKHSYLYDKLIEYNPANSIQQLTLSLADTRENAKALIIEKDNKEYRMNSLYRPFGEAEKWVKQYPLMNLNKIITMYGFGTGIFIGELQKHMNSNDLLFVYEPSAEVFIYVLNHCDITDYLNHENIMIAVEGLNEDDFHVCLNNSVTIENFESRVMCVHPQYDTVFSKSCIRYWRELKNNYYHVKINMNTSITYGKSFMVNSFKNLAHLKNSISIRDIAKIIPTDVPGVVVAAGPSLEKNIQILKELQNRVFIIAVDRISNYLLDAGIIPDMISTVDPVKPAKHFDREDITIPLFCIYESNNLYLTKHKGRKVIGNTSGFISHIYDASGLEAPDMPIGGSCATAAFHACVELGFKNIILVGQDLAYHDDISHAGGVKKFSSQNDEGDEIMVDGINGEKVRSRLDWYEFIMYYQDMLKDAEGFNIIDAKDQGAKIEGTIVKSLADAINEYSSHEVDFKSILENLNNSFNKSQIEIAKKFIEDSYHRFDEIANQAEKAIEACSRLIRECEKNGATSVIAKEALKDMTKINNFIENDPIYSMLELYITCMASEQMLKLNKLTEDEQANKIHVYNTSIQVFETIIDGINYMRHEIEFAIENIM